MDSMKLVSVSVYVFGVLLLMLDGSLAGTALSYQHRSTSLDELREIDSYVATGLPLFDHGFFVSTAQGPILIKEGIEEGTKQNKPKLNPGYYSTLPRLIPSGYEGISISHFNLGSAFPAQSPIFYPPQTLSGPPPPQTIQKFSRGHYQFIGSPFPHQFPEQSAPAFHHFEPRQTQSRSFIQHRPQRPQRRQDRLIDHQAQQQSPVAQDTLQINNFLNAEDDDAPTSYQNTMMSHESFNSRQLIRNPTVVKSFEFDDTLPENYKNPFYKNQALASALAKESLPVEGETIVGEWDTTKIQKKRISDLLRSAGFLR